MTQSDMFVDDEDVSDNKLVQALNKVMAKRQERKSKMKTNTKTTPVFLEVHKAALASAVARLKAIDCAFKIITPLGEEIVHDPKHLFDKRKRPDRSNFTYEYGALKKHYLPYVENVKVGGVAEIPFTDDMPAAAIQSSLTAHLTNEWGKGNYTTATNRKTGMLEVLRLA